MLRLRRRRGSGHIIYCMDLAQLSVTFWLNLLNLSYNGRVTVVRVHLTQGEVSNTDYDYKVLQRTV